MPPIFRERGKLTILKVMGLTRIQVLFDPSRSRTEGQRGKNRRTFRRAMAGKLLPPIFARASRPIHQAPFSIVERGLSTLPCVAPCDSQARSGVETEIGTELGRSLFLNQALYADVRSSNRHIATIYKTKRQLRLAEWLS